MYFSKSEGSGRLPGCTPSFRCGVACGGVAQTSGADRPTLVRHGRSCLKPKKSASRRFQAASGSCGHA
eukprot:15464418-Alexandrium_andersonii.AAC.1